MKSYLVQFTRLGNTRPGDMILDGPDLDALAVKVDDLARTALGATSYTLSVHTYEGDDTHGIIQIEHGLLGTARWRLLGRCESCGRFVLDDPTAVLCVDHREATPA